MERRGRTTRSQRADVKGRRAGRKRPSAPQADSSKKESKRDGAARPPAPGAAVPARRARDEDGAAPAVPEIDQAVARAQVAAAEEDVETRAKEEAGHEGEPEGAREASSAAPRDAAPPFLVAAIGSSAGGWPALSGLLRNVPPHAPLALLLVQHLSPDHKSLLPELLATVTTMPITAARDRLAIEVGHIYVIPPDTVMTVDDGQLRVGPRHESRLSGGLGPVDALFRSVSEVYRQRAVAVVLSGSGDDGAAGIVQMKQVGGVVIAQAPEEAEVDGMPRAAIATGAVDAVLPVATIGEQLARLAGHAFFRREPSDLELELASSHEHSRRIFHLLRRTTGVDFNNYKPPTLTRRIHRRMALHRIASVAKYVTLLERDARELHRLQADLLIHVTSFFREPDSFVALAETVLPKLLRNRREQPLRVWVPGCSTGEETYSLVVVILECLGERADHVPLQVFSTDISDAVIEQARGGTFPSSITADVSPDRLRRFFSPFNGGYRVSKAVRDSCVFARQDVTRDPPFSRLDLVVCRNLLIYLKQPTQRKVMSVFHYALKPEGVLMLGRSETAGPAAELFTVIDKRHQIYTRKAGPVRMEIDFAPMAPPELPTIMANDKPPRGVRGGAGDWDAQTEANRFLLDRYAPPALLLDTALKIVRSRGDTSRYVQLPSGDVSLDVSKMVRPEILFAVRSVVQEVLASGRPGVRPGVRVTVEGKPAFVELQAVPVGEADGRQIMLVFEEGRPSAPRGKAPSPQSGEGWSRGRGTPKRSVADLQTELVETRQQLQAIIDDLNAANEELQSANEEVLSSNEELQSTNEELDTAKEELQSTNEELSTLNDELQGRNEELSRVNSDLVNLLASVQIPIVMVSPDLKIRRFTPAAEKVLNIIPSDVGRPIGHLKPNFVCPDLEALITDVIDSVKIYEGEVETGDGRLLAMQIRPYKSVNNWIGGAVLALFEVSALHQQDAAQAVTSATADAFLAVAKHPILILDARSRILKVNDPFCAAFATSVAAVQDRSLFQIDEGAWDLLPLRRHLEETLPAYGQFEVIVERDWPRVGSRRLLLRGRSLGPTRRTEGAVALLFIEDVTAAPRAGFGTPPPPVLPS